ncbi:MAG TPA: sulfatase-like hydrolase/transferase [Candidatus Limnocylindrales bacterium]|nr:sulfatase-like hydrolase/transferase [Candidatus Limnocylindrales bacterium]
MASLVLRTLTVVLTALALSLYSRAPGAVARSDTPVCEGCNVILISFDTVRADHMSLYGYDRKTTPNVDQFAQDAVVFEKAISQAAWTLPAHGSMLSGLYPGRLGVVHYPAVRVLPRVNRVLPEVFGAAGYVTGGFNGGGFVSDHYGFDRGFDIYKSGGRRFEHNLDRAIAWLRTNRERKFFAFIHGYDAHRPYYSKPADKRAMDLDPGAATEQGRYCLRDSRDEPSNEDLQRIIRYYDASIHHGDRSLGVLFRALRQLGLMEKTVILLTSDHGEEFFEHGNCDHVRFLYRETVHVPYVLYVPGYSKGGRRVSGQIPASISVARTLLDITGIEHAMPGVSLVPMLERKQREFPIVYSEASSTAGTLGSRGKCIAITRPDAKLISYTDEGVDEAYDLYKDPHETEVLPEDHPAYDARRTLRAFASAQQALPKPSATPPPAEEQEASVNAGARNGAVGDEADEQAPDAELDEEGDAGEPLQAVEPEQGGEGQAPNETGGGADADDEAMMPVPEELEEQLKSLGYLE